MDFKQLGLSDTTIKAINEAGIVAPTTVQVDVIPSVLAGKDVFAIAPSGCGKTCSYVFPLIEIISRKDAQNILIITAGSQQSVVVSDRFAVFNKYHEISETTLTDSEEDVSQEANVIIASPDLLKDLVAEEKVDLSNIDILVVDDINLIKKQHQLANLEIILASLPAEKQNIVFTNRRSKETQDILDKILQTPAEIKVDRKKEQEAVQSESEPHAANEPVNETTASEPEKNVVNDETTTTPEPENTETKENNMAQQRTNRRRDKRENRRDNRRESAEKEGSVKDAEAISLMRKFHTFGRRTPEFLLTNVELADDNQ